MSYPSFPDASQTLEQLGDQDTDAIRRRFQKFEEYVYGLRNDLIIQGALDETERKEKSWDLRNRVLARHGGELSKVERSWLNQTHPDLKPIAGRLFNQLRAKLHTDFTLEALMAAVPLRTRPETSGPTSSEDLTIPA